MVQLISQHDVARKPGTPLCVQVQISERAVCVVAMTKGPGVTGALSHKQEMGFKVLSLLTQFTSALASLCQAFKGDGTPSKEIPGCKNLNKKAFSE